MTYLSEDPTYVIAGLLLLAGAFLIALKTTQQGKYLLRAGIALALALAVFLIEWVWVTDNERIEKTVYDVRTAVLNSDPEGVVAHLTEDVRYTGPDMTLSSTDTLALIRNTLSNIHLEFARVSELKTSVGQQTRRGTAEFRLFTRGSFRSRSTLAEARTVVTTWSLGFQETAPGIWKIFRISEISARNGSRAFSGGLMPSSGSQVGLEYGRAGAYSL
jgi:ketosteroid isomerase-like protein